MLVYCIASKKCGRYLVRKTEQRHHAKIEKEARPPRLLVWEIRRQTAKKRAKKEKRNFPKLFIKRREYMANNWADDSEELPPLGTLSKDESTKTTSTPTPSAEKSTYVPPHLRNRQGSGGGGDFGRRNDFGGRRDYRGRLL
jgi:hypothetical protein